MPWYVAQLKPSGLFTAIRNLERQKITSFSPMLSRQTVVRNRAKSIPVQLFPGYIFVMPQADDEFRRINSTLGVRRVISNAGGCNYSAPRPLPAEFVESLRANCDTSGTLHVREGLMPGDRVTVIVGPFSGFIAEVVKKSNADRVHVLLELLGRPVLSEIRTSQLDVVPIESRRIGHVV